MALLSSERIEHACHAHVVLFLGSDNIPEDLRDPFYIDQYEQEHIKPPVIKLLLSSELYCRVCSLILKGDQVAALQGHQSVIQALSRKGIYVMESDDTPVTDPDLSHAPIKMVSVLCTSPPSRVSCAFWGGGVTALVLWALMRCSSLSGCHVGCTEAAKLACFFRCRMVWVQVSSSPRSFECGDLQSYVSLSHVTVLDHGGKSSPLPAVS